MRLFRRREDKGRSSRSRDIAADAAAETLGELLLRGIVGVVKAIAHALN